MQSSAEKGRREKQQRGKKEHVVKIPIRRPMQKEREKMEEKKTAKKEGADPRPHQR
jgi:hypothetical protein